MRAAVEDVLKIYAGAAAYVVDRDTQRPIDDAMVAIYVDGLIANSVKKGNGIFAIINVSPGKHELKIECEGYHEYDGTLTAVEFPLAVRLVDAITVCELEQT